MVKTKPTAQPQSFEAAVAELEAILASMEREDLPLEESLLNFQRGMALLRQCQNTLGAAEQRVRMLENGQLTELPEEAPDA